MPVAGFEGPLASTPEKQGKRTSQAKLLLHLVSRTAWAFGRSGLMSLSVVDNDGSVAELFSHVKKSTLSTIPSLQVLLALIEMLESLV